ncbi:hypothetical protein GXW83_30505 [Streptacidiphilus sp. PB12-B1b]|uniref:sensor domain-containing protein n=1 Tax=Streptacidiphilus sp. PB12-B1b TaxID=2705012 RepID=UPI0015FDA76D|nr:sensor domain-containing protein [Streptacidiphilus sp. PB12-B1b]QMU79398.1 hypothetical protein GXW83_30505 [Streptacidiphilus sp. PB12-B1b]
MSSTLDSTGWPRETGAGAVKGAGSPRPVFWLAPFSARTWRETLQAVVNLPVGVVAFSAVVTLLAGGLGTAVTFVGLPLLACTLAGCRGFAAMERARAAALLDLAVPAPAPPRADRPGPVAWMGATLRSAAGWRAALYAVLMLPLGIASFTLAVTLWSVALVAVTYPLWQWVFPTYEHRPGIELYENGDHTHYLGSVPEIAGCCALGLLLLLLTPLVLRGVAGIQRAMVRGLLAG